MAWADKYASVAGGGAHDGSSAANAWTLAEAVAGVAAGDRVNIIAGTYTIAADLAFATAGTTTAPIWWRGYKTTIGDLDAAGGSRIPGTDLPKIATTNVTDQITSAGAYQIWSNIAVASTCQDTGGAWNATGGSSRWIRCQFKNTTANAAARAFSGGTNNGLVFVGCVFEATTTAGICVNMAIASRFHGCQVKGGIIGITDGEYSSIDYTTVYGFTTTGISITASATRIVCINHCTIYAAATNGVLQSTIPTTGYLVISNCIIGGCTNGYNNSTGGNTNGVTLISNQFYSCTNNIVGLTEQADVTADLPASTFNIDNDTDPWVAKASGNFNLASGVAARSAAYPGVFDDPSGTNVMTGYPDIGAVRHQDPASGGGGGSYAFGG